MSLILFKYWFVLAYNQSNQESNVKNTIFFFKIKVKLAKRSDVSIVGSFRAGVKERSSIKNRRVCGLAKVLTSRIISEKLQDLKTALLKVSGRTLDYDFQRAICVSLIR